MEISLILTLALGVSLAANVYLLKTHRDYRKKRKPDASAQEILAGIFTSRGAVVQIRVMDPGHILLYSPRDAR